MIIVSACLAGINCKYNGKSNFHPKVAQWVANGEALPVCPEQLGGCTTPRPVAEIMGDTGENVLLGQASVKRINGVDVTEYFIKGAYEVYSICKLVKATKAVFKAKSPSCGVGRIYDGSFSGKIIKGNGVTTALLLQNGIHVITEEDIE